MANHLSLEIGEGKTFKWITDNLGQRMKTDKIIYQLTREDLIILLKSIALNEKDSKEDAT